tara:strand:+ start:6063 stop:6542 length:480 start_codon:yes stop_codon:yes gene_type:complete
MAAETLTATRAAATFPVFQSHGAGLLCAAYGTYEIAANVEDGDIFEMCKVPKGAVVVGGYMYGDDLDTGTEALDLDVGWADNGTDAADPDGLGNFGVVSGDAVAGIKPEVSIFLPLGGVLRSAGPKTFADDTTIQIEANAAANSGGTGTITVVVHYVVP